MTLFFISHFIQAWVLPPGINLLLGVLGVLLWRLYHTLGMTLIIISFASLWLLSTPIIAWMLINGLQKQYPVLKVNELPKLNNAAIVVLGGGHGSAPEYSTKQSVSDNTLGRLRYAVYLYGETKLPIFVSGGGSYYTDAGLMQEVLTKDFKIPVKGEEHNSINTADEAKFLLPLLKENNIDTIYLITNAWHIPRSMNIFNAIFKNEGIKVIAAPMGFAMVNPRSILSYLPYLGALNTSTVALHEYIGIIWYNFYYRKVLNDSNK